MEILLLFLAFFIFLVIKGYFDRANAKRRLAHTLQKNWGQLPKNEYSEEKYHSLQFYYTHQILPDKESHVLLDEITWNDLNMDHLYELVNASSSSMGEEYLWALLHDLKLEAEELAERERLISFFQTHPEERLTLQMAFSMIGKDKKISVFEYMSRMENVKTERNFSHYLVLGLMCFGIILAPFFELPAAGILIGCVVFNIVTYYRRKGEISPYFTAFSYIIRMLNHAAQLSEQSISELTHYTDILKIHTKKVQSLRKSAPVVAPQNVTGDILSMFLDYVRIIFHTDLIKFNQMMKQYHQEKETILHVFETIGYLDSMCAIASFRTMLPYYSVPELSDGKEYHATGLYHPFLTKPVPSDIHTKTSVLVTGSNASGKSTFLKAAAVNAILAQTIHTSCAKEYCAGYFRVMSSMSLTDNLLGGESYYIVEIRSLKRILSASREAGVPVLCFVDEVLRGTNTVERIAASSRILHSIANQNALMFAATHDIELTYMLEHVFSNYHFEEQIKDETIFFDYQLKDGRATSQNAIQLLALMGYPKDIVTDAKEVAADFLKHGEWRKTE